MKENEELKLVQDYINFLGKMYIILLSYLDEFSQTPLSTNEKVVLQILDDEPISIKEISTRTGLALSTLTNVIDKMEEKRLVRRRHSRKDRRMVEIELEVAARKIKTKFNSLIQQLASSLIVILPEEDRKVFTSTLERMVQIFFSQTSQIQDILSSLEEPLKLVVGSQFKKK